MRAKVVIGVGLIVAALAFLIVDGLKSSTAYYLTVSELLSRSGESDRAVRVHGFADPPSIQYDAPNRRLTFRLFTAGDSVTVIYHGAKPDQLAEAQEVVLEGRMNSSRVFEASKIMLKCPSKYEAKRQETPAAFPRPKQPFY